MEGVIRNAEHELFKLPDKRAPTAYLSENGLSVIGLLVKLVLSISSDIGL